MTRQINSLTREGFDGLLRAFDADPQRAGARYHALRRKLIWFFETKGSRAPEDHADETLTRIAGKLARGERINEVESYALGVARFVRLESLRQTVETSLTQDVPEPRVSEDPTGTDADHRVICMERCLSKLSGTDRHMIVTYYLGERRGRIDARKALAGQLGIPVAALRIRVFRVRQRLHTCVCACVQRLGAAMDADVRPVPDVSSIALRSENA